MIPVQRIIFLLFEWRWDNVTSLTVTSRLEPLLSHYSTAENWTLASTAYTNGYTKWSLVYHCHKNIRLGYLNLALSHIDQYIRIVVIELYMTFVWTIDGSLMVLLRMTLLYKIDAKAWFFRILECQICWAKNLETKNVMMKSLYQ